MKSLLSLFLFLSITTMGLAQNLTFQSELREEESLEPVADAIVTIEGTILATKTDENGQFLFEDPIPFGEHTVSAVKEGYETKYFLINSQPDVGIVIEYVTIELTKEEKAKRRKERIKKAKEEKKLLKEAQRLKEENDRAVAKATKKLQKRNTVDVVYNELDQASEVDSQDILAADIESETITYSEAQIKYAEILGVTLDKVSNKDLYDEIDKWMGVTYLWGGETKDGIDCSAFSQILTMKGFDRYIERTAAKQYESKYTEKFTGIDYLIEGDLLFFKGLGRKKDVITHVGVYLHNNKFVHATSSKHGNGEKGVKVSDITDPFWLNKFVGGGRRIGE